MLLDVRVTILLRLEAALHDVLEIRMFEWDVEDFTNDFWKFGSFFDCYSAIKNTVLLNK
jgi:hypothetical protein